MKIEQITDRFNNDMVEILKFVTFRVHDEFFAVNILDVQEVILYTNVTTVPQTPGFISGVINLRNKVIPVVDLRVRLHGKDKNFKCKQDDHIIVLNVINEEASKEVITIGIIVDEMGSTLQIPENQIEPPPEGKTTHQFIFGVIAHSGRLFIIPDLFVLLDVERVSSGNAV